MLAAPSLLALSFSLCVLWPVEGSVDNLIGIESICFLEGNVSNPVRLAERSRCRGGCWRDGRSDVTRPPQTLTFALNNNASSKANRQMVMLQQPSSLALRVVARARRSSAATIASPSLQHLLLRHPRRRCLSSSSQPQPQEAQGPPPPPETSGQEDERKKKKEKEEKEAARLKKITKIKEEIRRGYFHELGEVNRTNSKARHMAWMRGVFDRCRRRPIVSHPCIPLSNRSHTDSCSRRTRSWSPSTRPAASRPSRPSPSSASRTSSRRSWRSRHSR